MFRNRQWPEGFEFPACAKCNGGTSNHDLLVGLLARFSDRDISDGRLEGMVQQVEKQYPGLRARMLLTSSEARRFNRKMGLKPAVGKTHQDVGGVHLPDEFNEAVCVVATKLGKGIYYNQTLTPFPEDGCIILHWFTNTELIQHGEYPVFKALSTIGGAVPVMKRQKHSLSDQCEYKLTATRDYNYLAVQARFFDSFGMVLMMCSQRGQLESMMSKVKVVDDKPFPFAVLQSGVIATNYKPETLGTD